MKRSRINDIMAAADDLIRHHGFVLPPFAYWSPDAFKANAAKAGGVIKARCGWDITDYGQGDFDTLGLFLFTLRNGSLADLRRGGGMCYAEKLLISPQGPAVALPYACHQGRGHHQPGRRAPGGQAERVEPGRHVQ